MREKNSNKYDLKEIKARLRENKKEQRTRIAKIRESFQKIKLIERILDMPTDQQVTNKNMMEIAELSESLIQSQLHQEELEIIMDR